MCYDNQAIVYIANNPRICQTYWSDCHSIRDYINHLLPEIRLICDSWTKSWMKIRVPQVARQWHEELISSQIFYWIIDPNQKQWNVNVRRTEIPYLKLFRNAPMWLEGRCCTSQQLIADNKLNHMDVTSHQVVVANIFWRGESSCVNYMLKTIKNVKLTQKATTRDEINSCTMHTLWNKNDQPLQKTEEHPGF